MERRKVLRLGGGLAAAVGVGAVGGVLAQEYRWKVFVARDAAVAVGPGRGPNLDATLTVWRARTSRPIAALTFDDGPDPKYTPAVLRALAKADVTATFFMLGKHVEKYPELARRVADRHEVGNHSYSHPDMARLNRAAARKQLHRTHDIIERVTRKTPVLFRPPYGRFSGAVERVVAEMDYDTILWSDRFRSDESVSSNERRLGGIVRAGSIVLLHDSGTKASRKVPESLSGTIQRVKDRGIQLVGMSELLEAMRGEATPTVVEGSQLPQKLTS